MQAKCLWEKFVDDTYLNRNIHGFRQTIKFFIYTVLKVGVVYMGIRVLRCLKRVDLYYR